MGNLNIPPTEIKELADKAMEAHKDFNSSMVTLSASILTISITVISIFTTLTVKIDALIISWISFALILVVIMVYTVVNTDGRKIHYWLENMFSKYNKGTMTSTERVQFSKKNIFRPIVLYLLIKMQKYAHWIVLALFIIGMVFLMIFTIGNIRANSTGKLKEKVNSDQPIINNFYYGDQHSVR